MGIFFFMLAVLFQYQAAPLQVTSTAFKNGERIPTPYTCEGDNVSPDLLISGIPSRAVSLVVIMEDPDAPGGTFDHWVIFNIRVDSSAKLIGTMSVNGATKGIQGANGRGNNIYMGPCPPRGEHRYHFKVYAIDKMLELEEGAHKRKVELVMDGHILAYGDITGLYGNKIRTVKRTTG